MRRIMIAGIALYVLFSSFAIAQCRVAGTRITVTGVGYPPRRAVSPTRRRLLAQRAAEVDAYRQLAEKLYGASGCIQKGSGVKEVHGYIKGARVARIRRFLDGKVEVDLVYLVSDVRT